MSLVQDHITGRSLYNFRERPILSCSVAPFSSFFGVAAPLKWSKPKKGFPFSSRVTEQLRVSIPDSVEAPSFSALYDPQGTHETGVPQKEAPLSSRVWAVQYQAFGQSRVQAPSKEGPKLGPNLDERSTNCNFWWFLWVWLKRKKTPKMVGDIAWLLLGTFYICAYCGLVRKIDTLQLSFFLLPFQRQPRLPQPWSSWPA